MRAFEFLKEQVIDEAPLPSDWDAKEFGPGTTFKQRLNYALERAKKLGTGSSRVAMTIEYQGRPTALKIAKNTKGLAQNEVEKDILRSKFARELGILIPLIDYDKQNKQPVWIQTELAKRATENQLCKIIGCINLIQLVGLAWNIADNDKDEVKYYLETMKDHDKTKEQIKSTYEYAKLLAKLRRKFNLELDDFENSKNWGLVDGRPVIIDAGFNTEVMTSYYNESEM